MCISDQNLRDCLPEIGRDASCDPQVEREVLTQSSTAKTCPPTPVDCLRYHDPNCFGAITINSTLIQFCSYFLTKTDPHQNLSSVVIDLKDQATTECLDLLKECQTLKTIESTAFVSDSHSPGTQ